MKLGLRSLLLALAVILFIVAAISNSNSFDLLCYGLAAFAGALLVDDLGLFGRRR